MDRSTRKRQAPQVVQQRVQVFTIERPDGVSLMLRLWPVCGPWQLREYDENGDEMDGRGDA